MARKPNAFDALDRKLGRLWSRIAGTALLVIGSAILFSALTAADFRFGGYWPALVGGLFCWVISWLCFRSQGGLLEKLGDTHGKNPPSDQ